MLNSLQIVVWTSGCKHKTAVWCPKLYTSSQNKMEKVQKKATEAALFAGYWVTYKIWKGNKYQYSYSVIKVDTTLVTSQLTSPVVLYNSY